MAIAPPLTSPERISCQSAPAFTAWLSEANGCLAVSTYQAGKLALIGAQGDSLHVTMREFDKPLGLDVRDDQLLLVTRHEVTLFANAPLLATEYLVGQRGLYDALFLPRVSYYTGDLNTHEVAFGGKHLYAVNTRFSCLSILSDRYAFEPTWQPAFITELVPEDRCHLNGLALRDSEPGYVTALAESNLVGGWRADKATSGLLIDVPSSEVVLRGLCMPHSPRLHQGHLYVLNSGRGELLRVNVREANYDVVCSLPAYLRGLCLIGDWAVVGMCKTRERHIFGGLPVQQDNAELVCGLAVIHLPTGRELGRFEFTTGCEELFDIRFLPGVRRPTILNLQREAARQAFPAPGFSYWLRPESLIEDHTP